MEAMKVFDIFSYFSGFKPNKSKFESAGICALKGAKVALYGMKHIDFRFENVKVLGIHFSIIRKVKTIKTF